jgi:hypothetical protein
MKAPGVDEVSLELERELAVGARQLLVAALEDRNGLMDMTAVHQRYGKLPRQLYTLPDVVREIQRGSQVLRRLRTMQRCLGMSQETQDGGALRVGGWLGERSLQVGARGLGCA